MDTFRGNFGGSDSPFADDTFEDETADEAPPPEIGADERRMQVRAYNFWAGLLHDRNFPNVEDLNPDILPDFGPNGVLLDFSRGVEDPAISFLGTKLAAECDASGMEISKLSDVPARSLLSRITDHYMQILANQAPIGFEAEFVNQRGSTILYRGILLPFSSDDETIDFIYGVINWKELADAQAADELLLEIDQALDVSGGSAANLTGDLTSDLSVRREDAAPMADWADGPINLAGDAFDTGLPVPSFGLGDDDNLQSPSFELTYDLIDTGDMALADWLAAARELALEARSSEDRTRNSLYEAIGRAHDFALAAADAEQDYAQMLQDAGLTSQDRAPMTPVVKLVFGADYDKTRLTEYAAALTHAQRKGLEQGQLADFLRQAEGGLKGVVKEERRLRRAESGKPATAAPAGPRKATARKLRAIQPRNFGSIAQDGQEFALVMVRRTQAGEVVMLGEVPEDAKLIEKAARKLVS